ncbi:MAG: hypothetical protein ACKVQS_01695 [Fimbriimonadaceae bacterium]
MASNKLKRDYPYLSAYMDFPHVNPVLETLSSMKGVGCLAAATLSPFIAFGVFVLMDRFAGPLGAGFFAMASFAASAIALYSYGTRVSGRNAKDLTAEDRLIDQGHAAIHQLRKLDNEKKLPKWMDPVAMQLLEAGAYHWSRVRQSFDDVRWDKGDLPDHWLSLREKAERAANLAMVELLLLCMQCVGEPLKSRKGDFQAVVEDFVGLDIEDALRGLAKVTASHPKEYKFQSPRTRELFEPGRALAEQLKELADEVETSTRLAKTEMPSDLRVSLGKESIDSLLSEMRYVREAEEELHDHQ